MIQVWGRSFAQTHTSTLSPTSETHTLNSPPTRITLPWHSRALLCAPLGQGGGVVLTNLPCSLLKFCAAPVNHAHMLHTTVTLGK